MSPIRSRPVRLPRAGIDPIIDEPTALALVSTAAARPPRHETILVLLDDARRGVGLVVVSDTPQPDAVVEIADRVLDPRVHDGRVGAAIVATVRACGGVERTDGSDADPFELDDAQRWLELDEVVSEHGVVLIEWFVVTDAVSRPRELVNAPARW